MPQRRVAVRSGSLGMGTSRTRETIGVRNFFLLFSVLQVVLSFRCEIPEICDCFPVLFPFGVFVRPSHPSLSLSLGPWAAGQLATSPHCYLQRSRRPRRADATSPEPNLDADSWVRPGLLLTFSKTFNDFSTFHFQCNRSAESSHLLPKRTDFYFADGRNAAGLAWLEMG